MKTQQEIVSKLNEISAKIESLYKQKEIGNNWDKHFEDLLDVLQIREDILEWVLEGEQTY